MRDIKDKGVLITGAGRGIGKRLAMGFASAGARVALVARSKAELDLADLEIEHAGGVSLRIRADVRDHEQMQAAAERVRTHYGRLDVLVCSAAVLGPIGPFLKCPPKQWNDAIETNLIGAANSVRAVLPHMTSKRSGKIILLGGRGAADPRPNLSAYAASKAGLARFAETLADELLDYNVQVNVMSPGAAYTHMTDEILNADDRVGDRELQKAREIRISGGVAPERQIELALFLASEESNHITGKLIHVNDDWKRFRNASISPELYTVRRVQRG